VENILYEIIMIVINAIEGLVLSYIYFKMNNVIKVKLYNKEPVTYNKKHYMFVIVSFIVIGLMFRNIFGWNV